MDVRSKGRTSGTITQQSKGYLVRLDINQRVFQNVVYVRYFWRTSTILFVECTSGGGPPYVHTIDNSIRLAFQHTSVLKDRSVRPPTLAYVRSRNPIFENALVANPIDLESKLTLVTKLLKPS